MPFKLKISNLTYLLFLLAFLSGLFKRIILIFVIVIIHEIGHIIMCIILKYKILEVDILPFGGITKIKKDINSPIIHDFLIAISGVIFQFVVINIILLFINNPNTYNILYQYNNIIVFFNLIPIIPLDGYKITKCLLESMFSYKMSNIIGIILSILLVIIFVLYNYYRGINNYFIIWLLVYKIVEEYQMINFYQNRFYLERLIKEFNFKKIKIISNYKLFKMKKNRYHFFIKDGDFISEERAILEKYY